MALQTLCFEGTKGAGKSSTITRLANELTQAGIEVELCAPFTEANIFAQSRGFASARAMISASKQDNQAEIAFIRECMTHARMKAQEKAEQSDKPVVLIYDRGWMTLLPHLYGGRWHYEARQNKDQSEKDTLDAIWRDTLDKAPETIFLHAAFEVTKARRSKSDIIGGLDTDDKLRQDVEERRAMAQAHTDKITLSFDTGKIDQATIVETIKNRIVTQHQKLTVLYGGSFNLSTLAHRAVGAAVRDIVQPDEVWYLVSPQNPHKTVEHMADFKHRIEMAKLNVTGMRKLVVTDIEREISEQTGSTASSETLRELMRRFPLRRFAWVVGADVFTKLHTWHDYKFITAHAPVIVLPRAGYTAQIAACPAAQMEDFPELTTPEEVKKSNGWYLLKEFPEGDISATSERAKVNAGERPDMRHVHPAVADYVARNGLRF